MRGRLDQLRVMVDVDCLVTYSTVKKGVQFRVPLHSDSLFALIVYRYLKETKKSYFPLEAAESQRSIFSHCKN